MLAALLVGHPAVELVIAGEILRRKIGDEIYLLPGILQGGKFRRPPLRHLRRRQQVVQVQAAVLGQGLPHQQGIEHLCASLDQRGTLSIFRTKNST